MKTMVTHLQKHIHFLALSGERPRSHDTPAAQIVVFKHHSTLKETREPWKKWPIPELGQSKYKMSLEQNAVRKYKKKKKKLKKCMDPSCQ